MSFGPGGFFCEVTSKVKEFKTYRQLLQILRGRGLDIKKGSQGARTMRILESENYYNVINGYKDFFLASKSTSTTVETYIAGTTFDEIYALYCFDRNVRNIYLRFLLKAENKFKTVVSHEFSRLYGHNNYLKLENFQCTASTDPSRLRYIASRERLDVATDFVKIARISMEENISSVTELLGDIQKEISRQMSKHHNVVTHYMAEHGYIPLWVLVNVLTFGKITNFYLNMKDADKLVIAKQFGLSTTELHKYMVNLGIARNLCAHDERFFDIRFKKGIKTKSIKKFASLGIPYVSGNYQYGTNDAYAVATMLSLILEKGDVKEFISAMKNEFAKLSKQLHTIPCSRIMEHMGFGSNWEKLVSLK